MLLGVTDVEAITSGLVGAFLLLALVTALRLLMKREARWRSLKVGVFLEREDAPPDEPPEKDNQLAP